MRFVIESFNLYYTEEKLCLKVILLAQITLSGLQAQISMIFPDQSKIKTSFQGIPGPELQLPTFKEFEVSRCRTNPESI